MRAERCSWPDGITSARALFLCGILTLPALLFQQDLALKALQVLLMILACFLMGRRISVIALVTVFAGVVITNLAVPTGRVLFTVLGFRITEAALKSGFSKAVAVSGMVALSKLTVRRDLKLPGRFGGLVGRCFLYFELIMAHRGGLKRGAVMDSLDAALEDAYGAKALEPEGNGNPARTHPRGYVLIGLFLAVNWTAFAASIAFPQILWRR